ncbi:hypothetical protein HNQ93_001257 [Hymenobacter luteus]|uniref:DUF4251 domain-containing protein n=2 Tax=Hymenobacter TaxID=89966 RepID=A0A7W9SYT1_9BACT|nr:MULTISPECIES: hypothetical protein [Hymenobacter]MBB4601382.1 hypothetical protein [Hymenobacter latericoloratus]MBB6058411.1 hypothetical protein [Hymenobacter luteus]
MRTRVLVLIICLIALSSGFCKAQQALTLDNLIAMQQGGPSGVNRLLLPKGWIFKGVDEGHVNCDFTDVFWAYQPLSYSSGKAVAFLTLGKDEDCMYAVTYQTPNLAVYNMIIAAIKRYNMTQTKSDVVTNAEGKTTIVEYYSGTNYLVKVAVGSGENDMGEIKNKYMVTLWHK